METINHRRNTAPAKSPALGVAEAAANIEAKKAAAAEAAEMLAKRETASAPAEFPELGLERYDVFGGVTQTDDDFDIISSSNWIGFNEDRCKHRPTLSAMGVPNGAPYLSRRGMLLRWDSPRMFCLKGKQFWTEVNPQGGLVSVTNKRPPKKSRLREHWEVVGIAIVGETLVPFQGNFRSAKASAAARMVQELIACANPNWAKLSPAHALAAKLPPALRFVASINTRSEKNDNGQFYIADASISPTNAQVAQLLRGMDEIASELSECVKAWMDQCAELESHFED